MLVLLGKRGRKTAQTLNNLLLRRKQNTTDSGAVEFFVQKGPWAISRIFRIFRVSVSAFSMFLVFLLCGISADPCFSGMERGPSAFSPYRVRIAGFENPTDQLYSDRP